MPKAIEIRWPRNGESGTDSYVNHRNTIVITEAMIGEAIGIPEVEVKAYLDYFESETNYEMVREWVTRKNMIRKERILRDKDFLLVAFAIGQATFEFDPAGEVLSLTRTDGETKYLATFEITPEEFEDLQEKWGKIGLRV